MHTTTHRASGVIWDKKPHRSEQSSLEDYIIARQIANRIPAETARFMDTISCQLKANTKETRTQTNSHTCTTKATPVTWPSTSTLDVGNQEWTGKTSREVGLEDQVWGSPCSMVLNVLMWTCTTVTVPINVTMPHVGGMFLLFLKNKVQNTKCLYVLKFMCGQGRGKSSVWCQLVCIVLLQVQVFKQHIIKHSC